MFPSVQVLPEAASDDELEAALREATAHHNAATARVVGLLAEADRRGAWQQWGVTSFGHWVSWQTGASKRTADARVRMARRLQHLPRTAAAFERGELSESRVTAICRVGTPANEGELLELARHSTIAQLERLTRSYERVVDELDEPPAETRPPRRFVSWHWDDDGTLVLRARLAPEEGALVVEGLEAAKEALVPREHPAPPAEGETAVPQPDVADPAVANTDALKAMAESWLANGGAARAENHQVVVHVELADPLVGDLLGTSTIERAYLHNGPAMPVDAARRLACDAGLTAMLETVGGHPLGVGRKTRAVPRWLRRELERRAGGVCEAPGCTRTRHLHAHHVVHWVDGGPTELWNLVLLCWHHHHLVHEGGWTLRHLPTGCFRWRRPDGRAMDPEAPLPPLRERVEHVHAKLGLRIDHRTAAPCWDGSTLDRSHAVENLLWADGHLHAEARSP